MGMVGAILFLVSLLIYLLYLELRIIPYKCEQHTGEDHHQKMSQAMTRGSMAEFQYWHWPID